MVNNVPQYQPPERKPSRIGVFVIRLAHRPAVPRFHKPIKKTAKPISIQKNIVNHIFAVSELLNQEITIIEPQQVVRNTAAYGNGIRNVHNKTDTTLT